MGPQSTWGISQNRLMDITAIGRALLLANDKATAKEIIGATGGGGEGPAGPQGPQGPQGIQGVQGTAGADGAPGAAGADGAAGAAGADGAQGIQGIPGNAGADGAQGIQGVPGNDGATGADGAQGIQGIQGIQGVPGADGADGSNGTNGTNGLGFAAISFKATDQTAIGTAYADVSGTGLAVAANKAFAFEFVLLCDSDAVTTGIDVACNGPASPTSVIYEQVYWTSATARTERCATAYDANTASTASNGTAQKIYRVRGVLRNGANAGTLIARAKREAVGTGPNVRAGSYGVLYALN